MLRCSSPKQCASFAGEGGIIHRFENNIANAGGDQISGNGGINHGRMDNPQWSCFRFQKFPNQFKTIHGWYLPNSENNENLRQVVEMKQQECINLQSHGFISRVGIFSYEVATKSRQSYTGLSPCIGRCIRYKDQMMATIRNFISFTVDIQLRSTFAT